LRALARLAGVAESGKLAEVAATIGADVPVCLVGRTCRMRGVGERLDILDDVPAMPAVLVNPRLALKTADVFAKLALQPGGKAFAGVALDADWGSHRNDLTAPALSLAPEIGEVLVALQRAPGVRFARMSGSGATCFGIFASDAAANEASRAIARDHPQWWVVPTVIG
jgi:4-diphosphocytidyl-2-C-methyl-D-erythritol kinase